MTNSQQLRSHVERDQHRRSNDHIFKYHVVEPVLRERRVRFCHPCVLQVVSSTMDQAHARAGKCPPTGPSQLLGRALGANKF